MANLKTGAADDWFESLIQESHKAKEFSSCPYSELRVGSALLTEDGQIFSGTTWPFLPFWKSRMSDSDIYSRYLLCLEVRNVPFVCVNGFLKRERWRGDAVANFLCWVCFFSLWVLRFLPRPKDGLLGEITILLQLCFDSRFACVSVWYV